MFTRIFAIASLAALAVAGPTGLTARGGLNQCNTGTLNCCNSLHSVQTVSYVLGIFSLDGILAGATDSVGINCHPITHVGTGSGAVCQQAPVCCTGNKMNGLLNIGCTPATTNA